MAAPQVFYRKTDGTAFYRQNDGRYYSALESRAGWPGHSFQELMDSGEFTLRPPLQNANNPQR